jgi:hypothetical protein
VICRADPLQNENKMTLPCGHCYHTECVISIASLCQLKICPVCRSPLSMNFITSISFHQKAVTAWNRTIMAFKGRTGHSIDCIDDGCHELSNEDIISF